MSITFQKLFYTKHCDKCWKYGRADANLIFIEKSIERIGVAMIFIL